MFNSSMIPAVDLRAEVAALRLQIAIHQTGLGRRAQALELALAMVIADRDLGTLEEGEAILDGMPTLERRRYWAYAERLEAAMRMVADGEPSPDHEG
jgi:hypothetical protein